MPSPLERNFWTRVLDVVPLIVGRRGVGPLVVLWQVALHFVVPVRRFPLVRRMRLGRLHGEVYLGT